MGRKHFKSPFVVEKIPTKEEVEAWEEKEKHDSYACTWDDFRLDLRGTPHSEWNNSVIDVFVKGFIDHKKHATATEDEVRAAFGSHVRTLVATYKRSEKGPDVIKAWRQARKTYERQKNVRTA